jgi:hypothetical protein
VNCESVQRCLLNLERPDKPPDPAREHLAECFACRAWLRRLLLVEEEAIGLPVPPPTGKVRFLHELRTARKPRRPLVRLAPGTVVPSESPRERGRKKLAVALALAAALLLIAVGVWSMRGPQPTAQPVKSLLTQRLEKEPRWAGAQTSREKLAVLTDLADTVQGEVRGKLQRTPRVEDMNALATLYKEVVNEGIMQHVAGLDREELEPLIRHLTGAESEFARLAAGTVSVASPLREMAAVARQALQKIQA